MNKRLPEADASTSQNRDETGEKASKISSIFPLTDMQKAFWLHCNHSDVGHSGLIQAQLRFAGRMSSMTLVKAWQATLLQYESLRTSINLNAAGEPLMVCREQAESTVEQLDWTSISENDRNLALVRFKQEDLVRGLDLSNVPNTRLTLIALSASEWLLVWTSHHLLLDGWSGILVINSLLANYNQLQSGALPESYEPLPYSQYRTWLKQRDASADKAYWKNALLAFIRPTLLCDPLTRSAEAEPSTFSEQLLDVEATRRLKSYCQRNRLTSATVVQGVWAVVLATVCKTDDVVIGISTPGRSTELEKINTTVGHLSTVVPLRMRLQGALDFPLWLNSVQTSQFEAQQHDCLPLSDILGLAEPACRRAAFDSLLVIENLPSLEFPEIPSLTVSDYRSDVVSGFPVTVTLVPGKQWRVRCDFQSQSISLDVISTLIATFRSSLLLAMEHENGSVLDFSKVVKSIAPSHPNPEALVVQSTRHVVRGYELETLSMPSNLIELELLALWEEVLQIKPLGMESDFFAMGGTSLAAVKLISMIESTLGQRIPVSKILNAATPRSMAAELDHGHAGEHGLPCIVTLQREGSEPALFCVHGAGGHALMYREFAARLGEARPVYGIQPRGLDGFDEPIDNSSDMARHYVDEITAVQPSGPYHLLFYCYGGGLMLEIAHLIEQRDLELGHVIMIDTVTPIPVSHPASRLGWRAYLTYEALVRMRWSYLKRAARQSVSKQIHSLLRHTWVARPIAADGEKSEAKIPYHLLRVQQACESAFRSYRAQTSSLNLHVLTSNRDTGKYSLDSIYDNWDAVCPNNKKHQLDVSHTMLFIEPQVATTSQMVNDILATGYDGS